MSDLGLFSLLPQEIIFYIFNKITSFHLAKLLYANKTMNKFISDYLESLTYVSFVRAMNLIDDWIEDEKPLSVIDHDDICIDTFKYLWNNCLMILKLNNNRFDELHKADRILYFLVNNPNQHESKKIAAFLLDTHLAIEHKKIIRLIFFGEEPKDICPSMNYISGYLRYDYIDTSSLAKFLSYYPLEKTKIIEEKIYYILVCKNINNFMILYNNMTYDQQIHLMSKIMQISDDPRIDYILKNLPTIIFANHDHIFSATETSFINMSADNFAKYWQYPKFESLALHIFRRIYDNSEKNKDKIKSIFRKVYGREYTFDEIEEILSKIQT